MKTIMWLASTLALPVVWFGWTAALQAGTTINAENRFAYGANIGWIDWRGDTNNGAVIGEFVCSGYIYGANVGWIHLGGGSAANGIRYQNDSATDFGVNHDGVGNLTGFAYGANIGWINFTRTDVNGGAFEGPRIDLLTGRLSGFAWSANCGWINLSNAFAFVQTDRMESGPDADGDGIPDAWELSRAGGLNILSSSGDYDADIFSDLSEYLADTNPLDNTSALRIIGFSTFPGSNVSVSWTSQASRHYYLRKRAALNPSTLWEDSGLGLVVPNGAVTTRTIGDVPSPHRFFAIEAVRPLSF